MNEFSKSIILQNKFQQSALLSETAFSKVFLGKNLINDQQVVIKYGLDNNSKKLLRNEKNILNLLKGLENFPQLLSHGKINQQRYIVQNYLGISLQQEQSRSRGKINSKNLRFFSLQLIKRLKELHELGIIHQDIKPGNIVIINQKDKLGLIDFGLSKNNNDSNKQRDRFIVGTLLFCSVRAHQAQSQDYSCDLESIIYLLVFLFSGRLPWDSVTTSNERAMNQVIKTQKQSIQSQILFYNFPYQIQQIFCYIKSLKFNDIPDYSFIIQKLKTLPKQNSITKYLETDEDRCRSRKRNTVCNDFHKRNLSCDNQMVIRLFPVRVDENQINLLNDTIQLRVGPQMSDAVKQKRQHFIESYSPEPDQHKRAAVRTISNPKRRHRSARRIRNVTQ